MTRRGAGGERKALWCASRRTPPATGADAPTPARTVGLPSQGGVLSFEAKESTKESMRHGDYGKKPLIAHFVGGARNVARIIIG